MSFSETLAFGPDEDALRARVRGWFASHDAGLVPDRAVGRVDEAAHR